ncbi:MAG: BON domain-containing protein [Gammaproteobacteria bacterium]
MTKTDDQLKRDIEAQLSWDPKVNAAQIGVSVNEGAVSLLGTVDTYTQKWAAEDATKRVAGHRTVAQDLTVKIYNEHKRSDTDIAESIQSTLEWDVLVPKEVTAKVHNGMVALEGQVLFHFQRESAERAVRNLSGVISIERLALWPPRSWTMDRLPGQSDFRRHDLCL